MVTIKDIAKACGVAVSTVSYALNNDRRIPERTRSLVKRKAKAMGYAGRSGRRAGKRGAKRQVVICLHSINGNIYTELFDEIHHILHVANCKSVIYCGTRIDELPWMDGMICLNARIPTAELKELSYRRMPIVLMDRDVRLPTVSNVVLDNFQGSYDVTSALIRKGARSFIYIAGPTGNQDARLRHDGFDKALRDNGLDPSDVIVYQGDYSRAAGVNIAANLLLLGIKADAIVSANDEMAMGVMDELMKKGLTVGKDVLVGGFDGIAPKSYIGFVTGYFDCASWASLAAYTLLRDFEKPTQTFVRIPIETIEY